ncbi:hypothetical protein D918_05350 [Trichuris suis]|nr:hypothetical protein D918_05350 [Trichuris suis]
MDGDRWRAGFEPAPIANEDVEHFLIDAETSGRTNIGQRIEGDMLTRFGRSMCAAELAIGLSLNL